MEKKQKYPNTAKLVEDLMPVIELGSESFEVENLPYMNFCVGHTNVNEIDAGNFKSAEHLDSVKLCDRVLADKFEPIVWYPHVVINYATCEPLCLTFENPILLLPEEDLDEGILYDINQEVTRIDNKDFIDKYIGVWHARLIELGYIKKLHLIIDKIGDRKGSSNIMGRYSINPMPLIEEFMEFKVPA